MTENPTRPEDANNGWIRCDEIDKSGLTNEEKKQIKKILEIKEKIGCKKLGTYFQHKNWIIGSNKGRAIEEKEVPSIKLPFNKCIEEISGFIKKDIEEQIDKYNKYRNVVDELKKIGYEFLESAERVSEANGLKAFNVNLEEIQKKLQSSNMELVKQGNRIIDQMNCILIIIVDRRELPKQLSEEFSKIEDKLPAELKKELINIKERLNRELINKQKSEEDIASKEEEYRKLAIAEAELRCQQDNKTPEELRNREMERLQLIADLNFRREEIAKLTAEKNAIQRNSDIKKEESDLTL
jgi:hypothetical protein